MFRKPMRIEKWIAFDGAGVVDLVETIDAADDGGDDWRGDAPSDDGDVNAADVYVSPEIADTDPGFTPFFLVQPAAQSSNTLYCTFADYPEYDDMVSLTFPIGMSRPDHVGAGQAMYMPFFDDGGISLNIDPAAGIDLRHMFISVSFPESGRFTIFSTSLGISFSEFVVQNNIPVGALVAYSPDGIHDTGDSTATIRLGTVVAYGGGTSYGVTDSVHVARGLIHNGSLRLGFLADATPEYVGVVLNSLVYRPASGDASESFSVSIYYDEEGTPYSPHKLSSGSGSAFVAGNSSGAIEDASKPCDENGTVIGGGDKPVPGAPDPEPEPPGPDDPGPDPDPDPDPPTDPYVPPPTDNKGDGDGGDDASRETQDGSDAIDLDAESNGAGIWTVFVAEKEYLEEEENADAPADDEETDADETRGQTREASGPDAGTLFPDDDLIREVELALAGVREVHRALAEAMNRLYAEYAHRQGDVWPPGSRERLAEMIAAGNAQKRQLVRMTELMNREMDVFRVTPPARRDGMLVEATRELADAAARRAGDAGPLVEALGAVADLIRGSRMEEAPPPGDAELAAAFADSHREAAEKWQVLAERRDPMGKDLDFHARLNAPVN